MANKKATMTDFFSGTFHSVEGGTFQSDTSGTFIPILSLYEAPSRLCLSIN